MPAALMGDSIFPQLTANERAALVRIGAMPAARPTPGEEHLTRLEDLGMIHLGKDYACLAPLGRKWLVLTSSELDAELQHTLRRIANGGAKSKLLNNSHVTCLVLLGLARLKGRRAYATAIGLEYAERCARLSQRPHPSLLTSAPQQNRPSR